MTGAPPGAPRPRRDPALGRELLRRGWGRAALHALLAFAVLLALGEILSWLQSNADPLRDVSGLEGVELPDLSRGDELRAGGLAFFQFHNVTTTVEVPTARALPFPLGGGLSSSFAAAAMGAMAIGGWLLFRGGRSVAGRAGGPWWARVLHGTKVALPYAVLALVLSFVVRQALPVGDLLGGPAEGAVVIEPSPPSAFLWPMLLGIVAGGVGGLRTGRGLLHGHPRGRLAWAALVGGWTTTWVALGLAFVGLLVLAAVHPGGTRTYFDIVGRLGPSGGTWFVLVTVLFVPNLATWVLSGAMGGAAVSLGLLGSSCTVVSYGRFPGGVAAGLPAPDALAPSCRSAVALLEYGAAPWGYFAFLLVPLAASVAGGWVAARRAGAATPARGAVAGAAAGGSFALMLLGLLVVSRLGAQVEAGFRFGLSLGPDVPSAVLLALAWGMAGGAVGGAIRAGRGDALRERAGRRGSP